MKTKNLFAGALLALVAAFGFGAFADDSEAWIEDVGFDGTDEKWGALPDGAAFAESRLVMSNVASQIAYPGSLPVDVRMTNLTVDTTARFVPHTFLPAVDPDAKGGVIAVADGAATNYWVLSKRTDANANEWVDSGLAADTANDVPLRMTVTTGSGSVWVNYRVGDEAASVTRRVYVPSAAAGVTYEGSGDVSTLAGWYVASPEPWVAHVMLNVSCDTTKASYVAMTNGQPVAAGSPVVSNATVVVVATPAEGFVYATVPDGWTAGATAGTITRDFTASADPLEIAIPDPTVYVVPPVTLNVTCDTAKQTYKAYTNGTTEVTGATVLSNAVVTLVVTPAYGYEYAVIPADWSAGSVTGTITRDFTAASDPTEISIPDAAKMAAVQVNIVCGEGRQTFVATAGGSPVASGGDVPFGDTVTVVATPASGHAYLVLPAGWTQVAGSLAITRDFTADANPTEITIPDAAVFAGQDVIITEFGAKNTSSVVSKCGQKELDWAELTNYSTNTVDLGGWKLSSKKGGKSKFATIPAGVSIAPGEVLVVYCGDTATEVCASGEVHLELSISKDAGKFLGLYDQNGNAKSEIESYPAQMNDISYGYGYLNVTNTGAATTLLYFRDVTPGASNTNRGYTVKTPEVVISEPHGYKTAPIDLTISCPEDPTAAIYYTLNGKAPTTADFLYTGAVHVASTTCIRAGVPDPDSILQHDASATYLYLDDILAQTDYRYNQPDDFFWKGAPNWSEKQEGSHRYDLYVDLGFPRTKLTSKNFQTMHYGFNANALAIGDMRSRALEGFTNGIDTISLVIDPANLFDSEKGIYVNATYDGRDWERQTMVECICPTNSAKDFSLSAGLRIRGGSSRQRTYPKHSFRLYFRGDYGVEELNNAMFDDEGVDTFSKMDLRTSQNWSVAGENSKHDTFIHETFLRDVQGKLGQPYTRSRYYHLYINGVYWGLYETQERGDEDFAESYLGGDADDYDVIKRSNDYVNGAIQGAVWNIAAGTKTAYNQLCAISKEGFAGEHTNNYFRAMGKNPDGSRNTEYPILLDDDNLMAYVLINHYVCNADSAFGMTKTSLNNLYAIRNRVDDETGTRQNGFIFLCHDGEHTFGTDTTYDINDSGNPNIGATNDTRLVKCHYSVDMTYGGTTNIDASFAGPISSGYFGPAQLHFNLMENEEYRMKYADFVYQTCLKAGGALTPAVAKGIFRARMAQIDNAICAEYARWDWRTSTLPSYATWTNACEECFTFIDRRLGYLIPQYRSHGWYPSVDAPTATLGDNAITLSTTNENVTIYYTTDGSDPRLAGGAVSESATAYTAAVPVGESAVALRARVRSASGEWSALETLDAEPAPGPEPGGDIITGNYPDGLNITLEAESVIKIGNATFGGPLVISGAPATLELQEGAEATIPEVRNSGNSLTVTGSGTLTLAGSTTLVTSTDFIVSNGVVNVTLANAAEGTYAVNLVGNFIQYGGTVNLDLESTAQVFGFWCNEKMMMSTIYDGVFNATVNGGEKSAAFKLKKGSNDLELKGGEVNVTLGGVAPRFVDTDGNIKFEGARVELSTLDNLAATSRVFKCAKSVKIKDGVIVGAAKGLGSEVFSADEGIEVKGGVVSVEADDDCFSSTNIVISAGKVQALSYNGDAIDSNGDVTISGGYVFATTLSAAGYGIEADGQLLITGGSVVAVGGGNMLHEPEAGSVACYVNPYLTSLKKYLVLSGREGNALKKLSVNLEEGKKRNAEAFSLLATVPNQIGTYTDTNTKPSKDEPKGEKLDDDIDGVFVTTIPIQIGTMLLVK